MQAFNKLLVVTFLTSALLSGCSEKSTNEQVAVEQKEDSAFFISRANGDTVRTGVPFQLKGDWKDTSIYNVRSHHGNANYFTDESPSYNHLIDSVYFKPRPIYWDSMVVRTPGTDTLLALEKISYKPLVVSLSAGTSKKMSGLRHKENARIDLQYFNSESGLPSSYTNALLFAKNGIMWIGTSKGLCRFDGNIVTTYTSDDGLPDNLITRLFEDAEGNIWIGTQYGGVARYDGYDLTIFNVDNGLPANSVTGFDQDSKGNIWIGTWGGGVSKFDGKTIETIGRDNGLFELRVTDIVVDKSDRVLIATNGGGFYIYDGKSLHVQSHATQIREEYLINLMIDSKDRLWSGNWYNLKYLQNDSTYEYKFKDVQYGIPTTCIFEDSKGNIWFASMTDGVFKYDGNQGAIFTELSGLPSNKVNAVCEDPAGNIWFATDGGGLCRYNPNSFNYFDESSGLSSKFVNSISEMKDGRLLFATDNGLVFFNDTTFQQMYFRNTKNLQTGKVYDVYVAEDSSVWFTVLNNTVYRLHGDSVRVIGRWQGIHDHNVTAIQERVPGEFWFGAWNVGLSRLKDDQFYVFNAKSGLHNFVITDLISDKNENLWIATDGEGITKYDGTHFTHITENEGLTNNHVNSFYEDSYDNIWVLTKRGIDIIENGEIKKFPQKSLLPDQDVVSMIQDNAGNYWIFTANGFLYLKLKDNVNSKTWQITNYVPKGFTQFDGLIGMDFIPRSVFIDSKNRIWFGSGKGLMMKNLSSFDVTPKVPEISLETIKLNGHAIDYNNLIDSSYDSLFSDFESLAEGIGKTEKFKNLPATLTLPPDVNHLNFMFSALSWNSDKILFTYKLVGVDENWSHPSKDTWAEYRNLSYGDYTFQLKGIGESEVESPILEYHFTILPPWYHTWWARIIFLVLIVLGVRFVVRLRTRQLELKQVQLENKVLERTAELDVKNKELVSQNAIIEEQKIEVEKRKEEIEKQHTLLEETHKEIKDSINYAKRIQEAILPTNETVTNSIPENFIFYKPKDVVAGDFYWIQKVDSGVLFAAADCTGHGVPGAMVSVVCYNALNRAVREFNLTSPEKILDQTREIVLETFQQNTAQVNDGMDAALIRLGHENKNGERELLFSGANNSVAILRNGELIEIDGDKQPVGNYLDAKPFSLKSFTTQKGDIIYLFTDGYADQFGGPKGKKLKSKALKELLISISNESMEAQKEKLNYYLEFWKGDLEQLDDISIFGFKL